MAKQRLQSRRSRNRFGTGAFYPCPACCKTPSNSCRRNRNLILPTGNLCDLFPALNAMAQAHPLILIGISAATLHKSAAPAKEQGTDVAETAAPDSGSSQSRRPRVRKHYNRPTDCNSFRRNNSSRRTGFGISAAQPTCSAAWNWFTPQQRQVSDVFHQRPLPRAEYVLASEWRETIQGKFVDGKREGLWHMWLDNGKPDKQGMFVNVADGLQIFGT